MRKFFRNRLTAVVCMSLMLFFGVTGCSWHDAGQFASDHVSSVGGGATVDPVTGAITVTGNIGIKDMEEATAISSAIKSKNASVGNRAQFRSLCEGGATRVVTRHVCDPVRGTCREITETLPAAQVVDLPPTQTVLTVRASDGNKIKLREVRVRTVDPCGNRSIVTTFEKIPSLWHRFLHVFDCECKCPQSTTGGVSIAPVIYDEPAAPVSGSNATTTTPTTDPGVVDAPALDPDTDSIINEVLANGQNDDAPKGASDRAVVFGNNYPGTSAELGQCVNDAKKNVVNLVKVDGFSTRNIRLFLNRDCTKANYEKWSKWALVDGVAPSAVVLPEATASTQNITNNGDWGRRAWFNSSHGAEDTDANGRIIQVLVTDDMVRLGRWDSTTEVSFDYWYALLRQTNHDWMMLNDSCHSGGQTRYALGLLTTRKFRSLDGPPAVQARLAQATTRSTALGDLGKLTGTVFAVCLPPELASEGPNGGVGTNAYWNARKKVPVESKRADIVKECNRLFRLTNESQHFTLLGVSAVPLWSGK